MRYEEPLEIDLAEIKARIVSGNPTQAADALLRASISPIDPKWVEVACLRSLEQSEIEVQWAALIALENLVRRHRSIDVKAILSAVEPLQRDPRLSGVVSDLLDDIEMWALL